MSANTVLILSKVKKGYKVVFKDIEAKGNYGSMTLKTLKKALLEAKKIQDSNNIVEYGIYIKSL